MPPVKVSSASVGVRALAKFELAVIVVSAADGAAFAVGADVTVNTPAVNADTATSEMRCLIVFFDIIPFRWFRIKP